MMGGQSPVRAPSIIVFAVRVGKLGAADCATLPVAAISFLSGSVVAR